MDVDMQTKRSVTEYDPLLRPLIWASRIGFDGPGATLFDLQTDVSRPQILQGISGYFRTRPPCPAIFLG
jgi:hypothetical protein